MRCLQVLVIPAFRRVVTLLLFVLFLPSGRPLCGDPADWRFFQAPQGAEESYISHVTIGPGERIWITHGSTRTASWMDGWPDETGKLVFPFPSPGQFSTIKENSQGQLWSYSPGEIKLFMGSGWVSFIAEPGRVENKYPEIYHIFPKDVPFLPGDKDRLFYLTGKGLVLFDAAEQRCMELFQSDQTGIGPFLDLTGSREGRFWITGNRGIGLYDPHSASPDQAWQEFHTPWAEYASFRSPVEGCKGELYIVADNIQKNKKDLLVFENKRWIRKTGYSGSIDIGWPGIKDSYWIINDNGDLYRISAGKGESKEAAGVLSGNISKEVALDENGVFWLATSRGLARYTPPLWQMPPGLDEELTRCHAIYEDSSGNIYLAADRNVLVYDGRQWRKFDLPSEITSIDRMTVTLFSLPENRVAAFFPGRRGCFLISPSGLSRLPYHDPKPPVKGGERIPDMIFPGLNQKAWLSTVCETDSPIQRLEVFDGEAYKPIINLKEPYEIICFLEASNGAIWSGSSVSEHGLEIFRNGRLEKVGPERGYTGGGVFCLHEFEDGKIWAGGRNEIFEFDGSKWSLVRNWGLDNVYSIHGRSYGSRWVASTTGIHRYFKGTWVTYTSEDGLPNTAANFVFEDSRGTVWAGTTKGVCCFHPEADSDPPRTLISKRDNLEEISPSGETRLVFSAVDKWNFTRPERLFYSFRLDDQEWSSFRTSTIAWLSNLSSGPHTFEVRSMDVNYNCDLYPAQFHFKVLPPWYRESGFVLLATVGSIMIIVLLGYAIHRHFTLERLVLERTDELHQANVQLTTEQEKLLNALQYEKLLARVSSRLNSTDDFFGILDDLMETVGEELNIGGVVLYRLEPEPAKASVIGQWFREPLHPGETSSFALSRRELVSFGKRLAEEGEILISDFSDLNVNLRHALQRGNIGRLLILPVGTMDRLMGFICFCQKESPPLELSGNDIFKTIADIIANTWGRYAQFQARLEAERQQKEALQVAERASRMASIGVISAGITHEINQPLNDIKVVADSLLFWNKRNQGLIPQKYRMWLQSISDSVNRITEIIKQMRSYWISPDKTKEEQFSLQEAVREAVSLIGTQLATHMIRLDVVGDDSPLKLRGNKINLEQIVLNLVVNAMHALDTLGKKDKRITIVLSSNGNFARMEVRDNGPGILEGAGSKLFDPFYTTRKDEQGMGLGLAIVKRFCEGFGGRVKAGNMEEGGASFVVEIPLFNGHNSTERS